MFDILSVAVDAQGAYKARPWAENAAVQFTTVVDEENLLGQLYGFKAIPNGFLIDEVGNIAYKELGSFNIRNPKTFEMVLKWITNDRPIRSGETADVTLGTEHSEANALFREGMQFYRQGKVDRTIALWRQAVELESDNYIIRKQIWAVQNPEKFYAGKIDFLWQDEQLTEGR